MRHTGHALFRVTVLAALARVAGAGARRRCPNPDEAVAKITQMNKDASPPTRPKVRGRPQDPEAGARPGRVDGARQAPDQGAHPHPHGHRHHRRVQAARSRHQAVQEGDRDPGRHQPHKALVTPELTDAFNEAKAARAERARAADGRDPAATTPPPSPPRGQAGEPRHAAASPPERGAQVPANGLTHEPVTEGKQGSAISITVGVQSDCSSTRWCSPTARRGPPSSWAAR